MHIRLKIHKNADVYDIYNEKPITLKQLAEQYQDECPYSIVIARVNGKDEDLHFCITEDADVELLDIRDHSAYVAYQNTISMIYLKAVRDVLGDARVEIDNSLNKGFYTLVDNGGASIEEESVDKIRSQMRKMIDDDIEIQKIGSNKTYELDGYRDSFYGLMASTTGVVRDFELRKYADGVLLRFPYPSEPDRIPKWQDDVNIHRAFSEVKAWQKLIGVTCLQELNSIIDKGEDNDLILMSEALQEKKLAQIADEIYEKGKRIILITGPSSSGKTTTAKRLCIHLRVNGLEPLYIGTDDYFIDRKDTPLDETGKPNYENLSALDVELFNNNLNELLEGREVDIPEFDFIEGRKKFGNRITRIRKEQPIVIEGIHALNEKLTRFIDDEVKYRIYISPFTQLNLDPHNRVSTADARKLRRMVRDFNYRNKPAEETLKQWAQVREGEDKNIFPFNSVADVVFNTALAYELAVLKKYAVPLLSSIEEESAAYSEAMRLLEMLQSFNMIEDESAIPCNSIIREFIGGSVFVD